MKIYKSRKEVPLKYKWKLEDILNGKTYEELFKEYQEKFKKIIEVKDSKYKSKDQLLSYLKLNDELTKLSFRLENYLSNSKNEDLANSKFNKLIEEYLFINNNLTQELGPELPRIYANQKTIQTWIKDPEFENYKRDYEIIFEDKKHTLSKQIQEYRQKTARAHMNHEKAFELLTTNELAFEDAITSKGQKIKVTHGNRSALAQHKDKSVRKSAILSYKKAYLKHKGSLSNMLYEYMKEQTVEANVHNFKNTITFLTHGDRFSEKELLTLYDSVAKNKDLQTKYRNHWKKFYKALYKESPTKYDYALKLTKVKSEVTVEQAQKQVMDAFKPFGKEYNEVVKKAINEGWIDYMPSPGKITGAYSIGGTHGIEKKYILMNFDGTIRSTETLAHELGHSLHSYFSCKKQPITKSQYPIFVAEIASIFNELMLFDHLLKTTNDKKMKFQILGQIIEGFFGTVFKQTEWSNYEYEMYKAIEEGKPVSDFDSISEIYFEVSKKYTNVKKKDPLDTFASIWVPHFYASFYVYKYAIGQMVAQAFFKKYKEEGPEALQFYIDKFLSAGGSDWPTNTLRNAGIDLSTTDAYDKAFEQLKEYMDEWIKLGKEIFKI